MHENKRILSETLQHFITFLVAIILFLATILMIIAVYGTIMSQFEFEYTSGQAVVVFFALATLMSWPICLAAEALPKLLLLDYKRINKTQAVILYLILATIANGIGLALANHFVIRVTTNTSAILAVSLVIAIGGVTGITKRPEGT
ncbi:MAG: YrvL family regulatory protein [bacterium]|nr:YrvL family regulatory protein [bacterium]